MPVNALFKELRHYVGFDEHDEATLRALHPTLAPHFTEISEVFYARVLEHEGAREALTRGEKHVGQLKHTLVRWMNELFQGPWDEAYVQSRSRIGKVHVEIALPQHYMVSAMNVMRVELREHLRRNLGAEAGARWRAVERACDIDLALMLHTYREDLEASQARAERLATFGQLVGSIGHELRNPLGVIETSLFLIKGRQSDERTVRHLDRIGQQVALANEIITQLLNLIRDRPLAKAPVNLSEIIGEEVQALSSTATLTLPPGLQLEGDPTQLRQVVTNLVQNAVQFAGPEGKVEVTLEEDGAELVLIVDDSGPGIDPSIRNRIFEPLVTTRPGGVGLGLALVKRVVERHGGRCSVTRGPLGGARFVVRLPKSGEAP